MSEWAERNFRLSLDTSARPGLIDFEESMYQREILDVMGDPSVRVVAIMAAPQTFKTTSMMIALAHDVVERPAPIMFVQPTGKSAAKFSTAKIKPLIRDNPHLFGDLIEIDKRGKGNSVLLKQFSNSASIMMATAGSAVDLAGYSVKFLFLDEIDRDVVQKEGDFIKEARFRCKTFWDHRVVMVSSPSDAETSRIYRAYRFGDARKWHVPCHKCGHEQELTWNQVKYDHETNDPKTARYECINCKEHWTEGEKRLALQRGRWVATNPSGMYPSFHCSALMSHVETMEGITAEWLDVQGNPLRLRAFKNGYEGLPFHDQISKIDNVNFLDRLGNYATTDPTIPNPIVLITCGADCQKNRIEYQIIGWTADNQAYVLDYDIVAGSPSIQDTWDDFKDVLKRRFVRHDGVELTIEATAVDAGFLPDYVCAATQRIPKCYPVIGRNTTTSFWPLKGMTMNRKKTHSYYIVGDFVIKEKIFQMLAVQSAQEDYVHFPYDIEAKFEQLKLENTYFDQLSKSEQIVTEFKGKGRRERKFKEVDGYRREVLDTFKYAFAARFSISSKSLKSRHERLTSLAELKQQDEPTILDQIRREKTMPIKNTWMGRLKRRY